MKFAVVAILSCLCIFSTGLQTDTIWGNVNHNVRQIGTETIKVPSTIWKVKTHTFSFPRVRRSHSFQVDSIEINILTISLTFPKFQCEMNIFSQIPLTVPIAGIRHIDYKSNPIQVEFIKGGVGYFETTLLLTSQKGHGINSTFIFYAHGN